MLIARSYRRPGRGSRSGALPRRKGLATLLIAALAVFVSRGTELAVTGGSSTTASRNEAAKSSQDAAVVLVPGAIRPAATDRVGVGSADLGDDDHPLDGFAARILLAEGGPARNAASSAAGYGQFLRATWIEVFTRTYPELAQKLNVEQILALREVRPLAADLTRQYAIENAHSLQRLGIRPTEAVLSLAHAVGPAGAASVVAALPTQSVRELLSREALIANPSFAAMTASGLQVWAATRLGPGTAPPRAGEPAIEREGPTLPPAKDFRVDGRRMASEVLRANQAHIAQLRQLIDGSLPADGASHERHGGKSPTVLAQSKKETEAVLDAIDDLSKRPGYERFSLLSKRIRQNSHAALNVLRDLALIITSRMEEENAAILRRAQYHTAW